MRYKLLRSMIPASVTRIVTVVGCVKVAQRIDVLLEV